MSIRKPDKQHDALSEIGVSIIMPVHNGERFLAKAINSILHQTHENFELIIVNDSSTDKTQDIVGEYSSKENRIRSLNTNARHASGARNVGIAESKHAYIAFMDADDVAFPQRIERQLMAATSQPDVAVWGAFMQCITDDNRLMHIINSGPKSVAEFKAIDRTSDIIRCYGTIAFCKRDVLERVGGFSTAVELSQDSELWDRMADYGPTLIIPEVLQYYRQHNSSISITKLRYERKCQSFIVERYRAKMTGRELSAEDYDKTYRLSPLHKIADYLQSTSQLYGRKHKIARAKKLRLQATLAAALAFLIYPARFFFRR